MHEHKDWVTNPYGYNFGTVKLQEIVIEVVKQPDKQLEISVTGPFDSAFVFSSPIPHCKDNACLVAVTWSNCNVHLYLNGKREATKNVSQSAP
jgi:hypothetical protein